MPDVTTAGVLLLGGYCLVCQLYVPHNQSETRTVGIPDLRLGASPAAVYLDGYIIVIGGRDVVSGLAANQVQVIDTLNQNTTMVANLTDARYGHSAVVLNDQIIVCGGWGDFVVLQNRLPVLDTCEKYSRVTGRWTNIADMPSGRYYHAAAVLNDNMYVIGGWNGDPHKGGYYNEMIVYKSEDNKWYRGPSMLQARSSVSALPIQGHLLACGGYRDYSNMKSAKSESCCEIYSPYTNTWRRLMNLSRERIQPQLVMHDERVYLFGAFSYRDDIMSPPEEIDIFKNRSILLSDQPLAKECVGYKAIAIH